ncbi:hypothetical protein PAERUG_E15_London_28_01_14_09662 [Pseudomonas aeruginosa]|nr:hypothetical protein PAERUG_P54_2_London_24_VIM_2_04_13_00316 [Pseudomonas aeruginosa]CRR55621.1 hypothetical protein PAERUG_E15_London_28_01_14_09662 [Pseudomonas aeruginosa]CRR63040.1 hypothetical protein PAERUG_E16_London_17_VIM_2_04_14_06149 [Pseudomonas aeruginosa]CRX03758.1 hypothetical protein PAERUG_P63_London_25_VIM_2_03_14_03951 [Pseudomonas aeruginosa]
MSGTLPDERSRRRPPVRRQPPDPPRAATQLAALQAPDRVGIVAGIAQRLPAGPVVTVRQPRQLPQPGPQQVALARSAEAAQRLQGDPGQIQPVRPIQFRGLAAGPEVDGGQFSQQVFGLAQMRRAARHAGDGLRPVGGETRHDLPAQVVAREARILVGRILHPVQPVRLRIGFQFGAGNPEQGSAQAAAAQRPARRHRRQAAQARSTQQAEQQGLGLVVEVLRGEQHLSLAQARLECAIAGVARRLLDAAANGDLHPLDPQRDTQRPADRLAVRRPTVRRSLQAMVDMQRRQRRQGFAPGQLGEQMQQHRGIQPAGKRHAPAPRFAPGRQGL